MGLSTRNKLTAVNVLYREKVNESTKMIFFSCEGIVTEEAYFGFVRELFRDAASKINLASAREEFFAKHPHTQMELDEQNKSSPGQVLERLEWYLETNQFALTRKECEQDEYWLVMDVDDHTCEDKISEWQEVFRICKEKGYQCAVSNPFFEVWLLMHHDDIKDEDKLYAVNDTQEYQPTEHFRERLKEKGAPLTGKNKKRPHLMDYNKENIKKAMERAKALNQESQEEWPHALGTTVYRLMENIADLNGYSDLI